MIGKQAGWWLALGLLAGITAAARGDGGPVKVDDFEGPLAGWGSLKLAEGELPGADAGATIEITADSNGVRSGQAGLFYAYEVQPRAFRLLALQRQWDLSGMRSLRLWVKPGVTTMLTVGVGERSGATYSAAVLCPGDAWQEVHVNLDELLPGDAPKDPNGKLDLDQVTSLQVSDAAHLLVNLQPELQGRRHLYLDDVTFEEQAAPVSQGGREVMGRPGYLVDSFENGLVRWSPFGLQFDAGLKLAFFDGAAVTEAAAPAGGGKRCLKWSYSRQQGRVTAVLRDVGALPLREAKTLHLWTRTEKDGTYLLALEEKDGSRYQTMVTLKAGDGWRELEYFLSNFALADESQDENGKLDPDQVKQVGVADLSALLGGAVGENVLRLDEVRFGFGR